MLVSNLINELGYEMVGEDIEVDSVRSWMEAEPSSIAVCYKKSDVEKTKANVVLVSPGIYRTNKTLIFTYENLNCAVVQICNQLIKAGIYRDYSSPVDYQMTDGGFYIGSSCDIGKDVVIQKGAIIGNNVEIGAGSFIDSFSIIGSGTVIGENVQVKSGSKVGADSIFHYYDDMRDICEFVGCGNVVVKEGVYIGYNSVIQRGTISNTIIGENCKIGNFVDIGHDVKIGKSCKIVSQTGIAGGAVLKDNVILYGQVGINNDIVIGNNVIVKARTGVSKSVKDNEVIFGPFGRRFADEIRLETKIRKRFTGKEG